MCPEDGVRNQGSKRRKVHVFKDDAQEIAREKNIVRHVLAGLAAVRK